MKEDKNIKELNAKIDNLIKESKKINKQISDLYIELEQKLISNEFKEIFYYHIRGLDLKKLDFTDNHKYLKKLKTKIITKCNIKGYDLGKFDFSDDLLN